MDKTARGEAKIIQEQYQKIQSTVIDKSKVHHLYESIPADEGEVTIAGILRTKARHSIAMVTESSSLEGIVGSVDKGLMDLRSLVARQCDAYLNSPINSIFDAGMQSEQQIIYTFFFGLDTLDTVLNKRHIQQILAMVDEEINTIQLQLKESCITLKSNGFLGGKEETKRKIAEKIQKYFGPTMSGR